MSFARPDLLWLVAALPALLALAVLAYARRRRRVLALFGEPALVRRLGARGLGDFPAARFALVTAAGLALAAGAAGPQWGTRSVETPTYARSVVLAADVSKSMWARDVAPDRLERQRILIRRLLRDLAGDRLGLVAYAGRAHVLLPLTTDFSALDLHVDALDPHIVSHGGTSLALAIRQATDLVRGGGARGSDRAVILIGDGEALDEEAAVIAAVERAVAAGVVIHTVGIGTARGAPVPELDAAGRVLGYVRWQGEVVVSRLNEPLLRRVAAMTGGGYVHADEAGATDRLLAAVRGLRTSPFDEGRRTVPRDRSAWFLGLALLLLAADSVRARRAAARRADLASLAGRPRAPAVAALSLLVLASTGFGWGDLERGNRLYREGRFAEAAQAYRAALDSGRESPELHYNLGTALLRTADYDGAERHLRAALAGVQPDLRERAAFNLGNRFLEAGRATDDPQQRAVLLDAAVEAYRDALRLNPADVDAKWNLELSLRESERVPPMSPDPRGGGDPQPGGDAGGDPGPGDTAPAGTGSGEGRRDARSRELPPPLGRDEAERILSGAEQDERDLTRRMLLRGSPERPVERDW